MVRPKKKAAVDPGATSAEAQTPELSRPEAGAAWSSLDSYGALVHGYQPAAHHYAWLTRLAGPTCSLVPPGFSNDSQVVPDERAQEGLREPLAPRLLTLAPRGHAKSQWHSVIYPCWLIGRAPQVRIGLISNTADQARAFLREIKQTLQSQRYRDVFGDRADQPERWEGGEIIVRREAVLKDATLKACGVFGPLVSKRFDLIICDDILDAENCATAQQREKVAVWFWKTLVPCLVPGGRIIVVGTRWHHDDFYGHLSERPGWHPLVQRALSANDVPLWPERFSVVDLKELRQEQGSAIFDCTMQNDPHVAGAGLFQPDWFKRIPGPPVGLALYSFWDLATSLKQTADYTVKVTAGRDSDGNLYIVDVKRWRSEWPETKGHIVAETQRERPVQVGIEEVAFQLAAVQEIRREITRLVPETSVLGCRPVGDKHARALPLAALAEAGRLYLCEGPWLAEFVRELSEFPNGRHDDQLDAAGGVFLLARHGSGGSGGKLQPAQLPWRR